MSLIPKIVSFNEKWEKLKRSLEKLATLTDVSRNDWNDHFSDVYALCVAKPQPFADRLYEETKRFLQDRVKMLLSKVAKSSQEEIVTVYYNTWVTYSLGVRHIDYLFLYLNTQFKRSQGDHYAQLIFNDMAKNEPDFMVIGELGLLLWKEEAFISLKDKFVEILIDGIMSFKSSSADNTKKHVYQGTVESFVFVEGYKKKGQLEFYEIFFEIPYLETCRKRYELESGRLLQECSTTSEYVENVLRLFEEEQQHCLFFLHRSSLQKVEAQFVTYMVTNRLALLHEECRALVKQEQFEQLRRMYLLLRLFDDKVKELASALLEHIKMKGLEAISATMGKNDYVHFVGSCLAVHKKYDDAIKIFLENDRCLVDALDKALIFFINKQEMPDQICKSPEMFAKYCDMLLRKSRKGMPDAEVEEKQVEVMKMFKYLEEKDVFQKYYSRMFVKRLIHQLSRSLDAEEALINKLKEAGGYEFTNMLCKMLTDVKVSSDINRKFSEFLEKESGDSSISFFIYILQAASWPLSQVAGTLCLPPPLETTIQMFNLFYRNSFRCRKLTILHYLTQVEVQLNYLKKTYVVTMQMLQLVILLQFEKVNTLHYSELQEATQLTDEQFPKLIRSLIDAKLVVCSDQVLSAPSLLELNFKYMNKHTKIRLAPAGQRESLREERQMRSAVEDDRRYYLHAAIVRVMKSRKVLHHGDLVREIVSMCREKFTPNVSSIKKAIESLIEKQYIERTLGSPEMYSYVA